ncbi:MAG: hypothetical protein K2K15_00085, partial [Anaeroplasmataceae bacterium]|nr:hypothetical protein [Anaeroplasmataceae bacterium]
MYLNEVLQLDKTASSIKKIDVFLVSCNKKSLDYYKAFAYRNIILHSLGKTNEALKALYSLSQEFSKLGDAEIISICDAIIEITLEVKRFDQARKFMDEKKKHLRVSNALLNTKDEIRLALARKDYGRAISELKIFLGEILTTEEYSWGYESLAEVYYTVRDFKSYLEIVPELEKIYQDTLNTNDLIKLQYRKLEIAYTEGNYVKVICEGNRFLNDFDLDDERMLSVAALLLECYIHSKDYRKASIIESNYEAKLSNVSNETALAFCKAGLKLYTETSSLISMKHYQDLIDKYSQTKKKIKGKQDSAGIIIPTVKPAEEVKSQASFTLPMLHELTKDIHPVYVSKNYTKLEQLFLILNNTDDAIKFREVYRQALIELSSFIPFEEAFLLYFDRSYLGLHYKKERAYDKRLEYNEIMDTMNYLAIGQEQEIILDRTSTFGLQDIVSKTYYETVPYGIAIPLFKDGVAYASIAFWAQEPFLDKELVYETLKLISQMLNKSLIAELRQTEIRNSNKRMFFIYENMSSGIKELMEGHIHLSSQAKEILGSLEDIQEADFKSHIHAADLARYENLVDEIYHYFSTNQSIEYRYKKNNEYIDIK